MLDVSTMLHIVIDLPWLVIAPCILMFGYGVNYRLLVFCLTFITLLTRESWSLYVFTRVFIVLLIKSKEKPAHVF